MKLTEAELERFWAKVAPPNANGCRLWTAALNHGYGMVKLRGRTYLAHRVALILAGGEPPEEALQAAHGCGVPPCVESSHLRWATPAENSADRVGHGTSPWSEETTISPLTEAQVLEIRRRSARGELGKDLAAAFGVRDSTISHIVNRKRWAHV